MVIATHTFPSGIFGNLESLAARAVTLASGFGERGTYIETWARKTGGPV